MSERVQKVVGIIGGMGPESTADLFRRITELTQTQCEQEHLHVIVDSNPKVPDRTGYLLGRNESPLSALLESVSRLEEAGAEVVGIACNTAHFWHEQLQSSTRMQILDMVKLAAADACGETSEGDAVGVLATWGTVRMRLYERALSALGRRSLVPEQAEQDELMDCIYGDEGVKLGRVAENRGRIEVIWRGLLARGAKVVIAGCTEVMLPFRTVTGDAVTGLPSRLIDPISVLAKKLVEVASGS